MADRDFSVDITTGNRMYHVRKDTIGEFKEAVQEMEEEFLEIKSKDQPTTETPPPITDTPSDTSSESTGRCRTCDGETLPERRFTGKDGRSWWVRDCIKAKEAGDFSHKTPIRKAT